MRYVIFAIFSLFLTACTSSPKVQQLPTQTQSLRLFKVENEQKPSLLSVQYEPQQWRWVQTDPLGAPIARVLLTKNGWQNDGFVMPNAQAKSLYTALSVALNPQNPPFVLDARWQIQSLSQNPAKYRIKLPDGSFWQIEELPAVN